MSVTPSQIIEYQFCPRFIYFEYVSGIPQFEERHYKVQKGRNIHDLKMIRNKEYLRKRLGVKEKLIDQYLTNNTLRGKIDEVLVFADNFMAPLDYKFAKFNDKIYSTYLTQLYCYAVLIEENFGSRVNKAYLIYVRSKNKIVEIDVETKHKLEVKKIAGEVVGIIEDNFYPRATKYKKRCVTCTYRNICTK
ncbi:MAG: CRISPR-associated protein Cas4 [Chlorobi bacterium]|nr:CRISPR-associated protein Cas4 [Chlorobiota bacterium]